jgi:hypothetical protein
MAACLTDPAAPDVFGLSGWFGTKGLGYEAWHFLIVVEEVNGEPVPLGILEDRIGPRAPTVARTLLGHRLIAEQGAGYVRGPAALVDVARTLKTLGTRSSKRFGHQEERKTYRRKLEDERESLGMTKEPGVPIKPDALLKAKVLKLAGECGWPNVIGDPGEDAWRHDVAAASPDGLRGRLLALRWWRTRRQATAAAPRSACA